MKRVVIICILLLAVSGHLWAIPQTMYFQLPCTGSCSAGDYSNINLTIQSTPVITKTAFGGSFDFFDAGGYYFAQLDLTHTDYNAVSSGTTIVLSVEYGGVKYSGTYKAGNLNPDDGSDFYTGSWALQPEIPDPTITVTGATLCQGATDKTVTATVANAPAGYTIEWGNANITSGTPVTTGNIGTGLTSGTYNLTAKLKNADGSYVTNKSGAVVQANYTVKVNALPTVTITPTEVCANTKTTLTANPSGATSYTWSGLATGTGRTKDVTLTTGGNVTVEVTKDGCTNRATQAITVNPQPTVSITPPAKTDFCVGDKLDLTASASGGSGAPYTYTWNPAGGTTATKNATIANGTNTFTVQVKDQKNCVSNVSTAVTVTGHQVTAGLTATNTTVSNGGSTTLTATPTGIGYTYTWTPSSVTGTGASVSTGALTATETYTVVVTDNNGCKGTATTTVKVSGGALTAKPEDQDVCSGNLPISLDAAASGGSGTYTYLWTAPAGVNLSSTTAAAPTVANTSDPGTYTVHLKVTDTGTGGVVEKDINLVITKTLQT